MSEQKQTLNMILGSTHYGGIDSTANKLRLLAHRIEPTEIPAKEGWQRFLNDLADSIDANTRLIKALPELLKAAEIALDKLDTIANQLGAATQSSGRIPGSGRPG